MRNRPYGTRFTTGCGHSWRRRYPKWTIRDLSHASTDCKVCGELLMIPGEQFKDEKSLAFPFDVHMPLFHVYLNSIEPEWPIDGAGTGYVEFDTE